MNLLASRSGRRLLFTALYFSEGAPIGYIWWAMPTRLSDAGIPSGEIAKFMSLLVLPWALKFLWAPLVDSLRTPRWGRRAWIVAAQIAMGVSLLPFIGLALTPENLPLIQFILVTHAVLAATQDVAVDALAVSTIPHHERGKMNGWMQAGMLASRGAFGGLALMLEQIIGAEMVIAIMIVCIWSTTLLLLLARTSEEVSPSGLTVRERFGVFHRTLGAVLRKRGSWLGFAFAATGGAAWEATAMVAGPLLLAFGVAQESVGMFYAGPVIACMILGSLAGGAFADRVGHRKMVIVSSLCASALIASLGATIELIQAPPVWSLIGLLSALYLVIGSYTASSYAMFMNLTSHEVAGTQFSAFMGATNMCEAWSARLMGSLIGVWGFAAALLVVAGIGLLALPMVPLLKPVDEAPPALPDEDVPG